MYPVNSGSEANELAMKLASLHTGNRNVISLQNCYHGVTGNTQGLTAMSTYRKTVCSNSSQHHAMLPDVFNGIWGGKSCRDSPVQVQRPCECAPGHCGASDKYYGELKKMFNYTIPRGSVASFFAESIQVNTHYGAIINLLTY